MSRRLFSRDDVTGITKWFHYNDATDEVTIHTEQDLGDFLEQNQKMRNNQTSLDRWGDGKIVASIPMTIYAQWLVDGRANDQAFLKRWLNDPENKVYRTFAGKV